MINLIEKVIIERNSVGSFVGRNLISSFPREKIEVVETFKDFKFNEKKWYVICREGKGAFLKDCPCTPNYRGCNYKVLNLIYNCYLSCTYCILQSYLGGKIITIFSNYEDVFKEIELYLENRKDSLVRFGTGELSDSLFLDNITGISKNLMEFFSKKKNGVIELKTKTVKIDHLLDVKHNGRTIFAWSLNPVEIALSEEKLSPHPYLRIEAAKRAQERGFFVAFHFDPIIYYDGWLEGYSDIISKLERELDPEKVVWISMGSLRFMPSLLEFVEKEYPDSKIFYNEFIIGLDGKKRYFLPLRKKMYKVLFSKLKDIFPDVPIYFCMESDDLWEEIIGFRPKSDEEVGEYIVGKIRRMLL